MNDEILLVGAGPMAIEYAKVLKAQNIPMVVVGRGENSAKNFEQEVGTSVFLGGLSDWLHQGTPCPQNAIVCVGEKLLGKITRDLIGAGVKSILVEKPGGYDSEDIREVAKAAQEKSAKVYVGYNRRFYASTRKAKEMIMEDGGAKSFNFEFTEWGHVIAALEKEEGVKEEWFLANSSHVIDHAFFLGGKPKEFSCYSAGGVEWHPNATIYAGAGITELGALFSYQANWEAPGRWAVEILTKKHRYIFKPMEKLQIQKVGSVQVENVELDDELDQKFKPGLYLQVKAFLGENKEELQTIQEQVEALYYYDRMNQVLKE